MTMTTMTMKMLLLLLSIVAIQQEILSFIISNNNLPVVSSFSFFLPLKAKSTLIIKKNTMKQLLSSPSLSLLLLSKHQEQQQLEESTIENLLKIQVTSISGLSNENELPIVLDAIRDGYANGLGIELLMDNNDALLALVNNDNDVDKEEGEVVKKEDDQSSKSKSAIMYGALNRVISFYTNLDDDTVEILHQAIAQQLDERLYSNPPKLRQPVLISINNNDDGDSIRHHHNKDDNNKDFFTNPLSIIKNEIEQYELVKPIGNNNNNNNIIPSYQPPTLNVILDGAMTNDDFYQTTSFWDTSDAVVFDGLVSDSLRRRLLDVVLGIDDDDDDGNNNDQQREFYWDDVKDGPNPNRWVRGGLSDVPTTSGTDDDNNEDDGNEEGSSAQGSCWGLPEEFIDGICFRRHDAINEFEDILSNVVFPQFVVTRLPEAVFGASVSPLTANAPTYGDMFDYHIDGDPNLTPPSPWTDVFGRYPNRIKGKPRFMSCIVYLNDEWEEDWGAPTKFLDPPTNEVYEVLPKPGRIVLSDQDCRHTVVAPNESAGNRPRYSLVWKLILHPTRADQDMMDLANGRDWPTPVIVGSAAEGPA